MTAWHYQLADRLREEAQTLDICPLPTTHLRGGLSSGQIVSVQQAFYFKRTQGAGGKKFVRFHATSNTDDHLRIEGLLDPERFTSNSSHGHLSGRTSVLVIGQVLNVAEEVRIRPLFVGWESHAADGETRIALASNESREVHPSQVDNFSPVEWGDRISPGDLNAVAGAPEADVKRAIAALLNEFDVPPDWGGERSDIYSLKVRVGGVPLSSSWLLKGKSVKRKMTVADLGKNGDQMDRLASEQSRLLVVQSNSGQVAAVRNTLGAYAYDMRNPRLFMTLDGEATARILRHFNYFNEARQIELRGLENWPV
ncbi:MAG TPA: hypothetical protein DHV14_12860 [Micrococcales bacterium]|nr:hypothetical protein [Micrococcales bacterium]